jgi:hypothetical protein
MVLTQVKAAGLVQTFGLLAFSDIDAPRPPLIQEGELGISSLFSSNSRYNDFCLISRP